MSVHDDNDFDNDELVINQAFSKALSFGDDDGETGTGERVEEYASLEELHNADLQGQNADLQEQNADLQRS